jgi:hypothetical protein
LNLTKKNWLILAYLFFQSIAEKKEFKPTKCQMSNKQFLKNHNIAKNEQHPFHLVDNSPWPLFTSIAALQFIIGLVSYMHRLKHSLFYLYIGLAFLLFCMYR